MSTMANVRVWATWGNVRDGEDKVRITYMINSLRDGGAERRTIELLKHINRRRFIPSLMLMEETGLENAQRWAQQSFVMGMPQSGNARWLQRTPALFKAVWKTQAQLRAWRPHVVHALLPAASIIGAAAARMARVPVFLGSRPCLTEAYRWQGGMLALADQAALRIACSNISNSLATRADLIAAGGCPPHKCLTIYNGVDTSRFYPGLPRSWRASMGWDDRNIVFGLIANFRRYKRQDDFVRAAALILKKYPEARFLLMGADYGTREVVQQQIWDSQLEAKVRIVAADPAPEKQFAAMDIYVCTSESEGLSNVLLEAMSCGKPVIATEVGGNPEVVVDGQTGFLVPCGQPEAIAQAAGRLIADPGLRLAMGRCGRLRVERQFSLERMVRDHEELYLRLLAEKGWSGA
jgi:glycosyltransferase involved in cell wall biosynthesis